VNARELSPAEAVSTYLFNSQIVTLPGADMAFVAPAECEENPRTRAIIERILADDTNPIRSVHYVNIRQSMKNGGGPACLRLRIVLNKEQIESLHPRVLLTQKLYDDLRAWIVRHYRNRLTFKDLADPALLAESRSALDELTQILDLGSIYNFQQ
jgi:succinylarginine dihydrolase